MGSELGVTADSKPVLEVKGINIWWICWACGWTSLVVAGMAYLISKRHMPVLRIRGLTLSLSAITLLHLYWASVQIGPVIGPLVPGDAEFWIMGTYLPIGIGLFHASNSRFLHIAKKQRRFADPTASYERPARQPATGILGRFRALQYTTRMLFVVGMGLFFQVCCVTFHV